jgi:PIN domain nuclease of toxin-antitoxin system
MLSERAVAALDQSSDAKDDVYVSPVTAWEVGMLVAYGRYRVSVEPSAWFDHLIAASGFAVARLPAKVLVASSFLPGKPPSDPADRIIIATAREYGFRIMTRDRKILDYADQGHVQAIAC